MLCMFIQAGRICCGGMFDAGLDVILCAPNFASFLARFSQTEYTAFGTSAASYRTRYVERKKFGRAFVEQCGALPFWVFYDTGNELFFQLAFADFRFFPDPVEKDAMGSVGGLEMLL